MIWMVIGTGRTDGRKLYRPILSIPSQLPRSRGFARAVDKPTKRIGWLVCDEMKRMRLTIISYETLLVSENVSTVEQYQDGASINAKQVNLVDDHELH